MSDEEKKEEIMEAFESLTPLQKQLYLLRIKWMLFMNGHSPSEWKEQ